MEATQANGWFQKHVLASLDGLNKEIVLLRASTAKVEAKIEGIHNPPCTSLADLKHNVGKAETTLALFRWLMGGMVLSLLGLVITLVAFLLR